MDVGLHLFGGTASGVDPGISLGDGSLSTVSKAEPTELGLSPEVSSNELDLGLGLSLGGGGVASKPKTSRVEYVRILTSRDLSPSLGSASSSSSSSSSSGKAAVGISPCATTKAAAVSGTKRAADESVAQEGGSPGGAVSNQVVGWPPLRNSRINISVNQPKNAAENDKVVTENTKHKDNTKKKTDDRRSIGNVQKKVHLEKSTFVKVNMDGVPIGRKVDLSAHTCYETLAGTLEDMFFYKPAVTTTATTNFISLKEEKEAASKLLGGLSEFVLTYEDKDGDWMLVGDVPWGMFLSTAKRLKIMRMSEANGFAPRSDGISGRQRNKLI